MLSVLFATEACYTVKENNSKEKSFCWGQLLVDVSYHFAGRKAYFVLEFFLPTQIIILVETNW